MTVQYKTFMNPETTCLFLNIEEEQYKDVWAKIANINLTENQEVEFDFELPDQFKKFETDDDYTSKVGDAVGDILEQSIKLAWGDAEKAVLSEFEQRARDALKVYNIQISDNSSIIEMFGEKGYVISEDDDCRLIAIKSDTNAHYYFDRAEELAFLKKEITGTTIIL